VYKDYSTQMIIINYAVRLSKFTLDAYMICLFLSMFWYYVKVKKSK